MKMEVLQMVSAAIAADFASENGNVSTAFRWGASFSVLFLLVLNLLGRRSRLQASLLAVFLTASLPAAIFQILRGQFGRWVAILGIASNYCFPSIFPASVSRFLLFVVMPNWLANELRESLAGGVFCLLICVSLFIMEIHANGGCSSRLCTVHCCAFWFSMALLFFFTILYLCLGSW
ncbi:hypothetical protein BVRB_6g137990 [Beta vulgaris subsp. vulgaris]|uniref:cold-regulated 413 plasma membrane protein 4 n=1 Tax=Beta vulgaris subsp. vulgaris TaxID=3555 RepID=UPI0005402DD5|nr:cold-regulated 413 plasma membrane protein 4 [Beta vulgaris subsp. vulgaris]KMT08516.1 hypothetical protein BVRB_6g137990 [Beta vulgaris subsp. vulgaris]